MKSINHSLNLKWFAFIVSATMLISSCTKEEERITRLSAKVNGVEMNLTGSAVKYTDTKNDKAFRIVYQISNSENPSIWIEAYDSSFVMTYFDFSHLKATYYSSNYDSLGRVKTYDAINGELLNLKEKKRVLFGNFRLTFVNRRDHTDTIKVSDGSFELTLLDNPTRNL